MIKKPTCGNSLGNIQVSIVILPYKEATDFINFCSINSTALPLNNVGHVGNPMLNGWGRELDIRHELPIYRIYRDGKLVGIEPDIKNLWHEDLVAISIGCSFSFEGALIENGVSVRHIEEGKNVPMYITNIETKKFGKFGGPAVVSMRPVKKHQLEDVHNICEKFLRSHGAPIHTGDPAAIGIKDINHPDFGDSVNINDDEIPVFWGCGVTALTVIEHTKPALAISHEPGHMLVTDVIYSDVSDPLREKF